MSTQPITTVAFAPRQTLGYGIEAVAGELGTPYFALPFEGDMELASAQPLVDTDQTTGRLDPTLPLAEWEKIENSAITVPTDTTSFAYWLAAMFGAPSAGVYSLPASNDTIPSLSLYRMLPDIGGYLAYAGVRVNAWNLSFGQSPYVTSRLQLVGAAETFSDTDYPTTPSAVTPNVPMARAGAVLTIGGATTTVSEGAYFTFNFNMVRDQYPKRFGGIQTNFIAGRRHFAGQLNVMMEPTYAKVQYAAAIAQTPQAMSLAMTSATGGITVALPNVLLSRPTILARADKYLYMRFYFTAYRPTSGDAMLTVTVS